MAYFVPAISAWNEPIKGGGLRGTSLRPVYPQVAGDFVNFVFDQIEGGDFDISVDDLRGVRAEIESVPGVRTPTKKRFWKCHRMTPFRIGLL